MNGIRDLADIVEGLTAGTIAPPVQGKLRLHVADTLAALVAATATDEGRALLTFRRDLRSAAAGDNLFDDLMTACALTRLSEVDDIHLASMTTAGSIVVPAALTMAAGLPDIAGEDIAPAILAGYEAMIRLGLAIKGPEVLYRGIWPTYFSAALGTAAVAARLMRLGRDETAHALAQAFTLGAPSVGRHHAVTTTRWLSVGVAARNGLTAALAARAGFTSDVDVLQSGVLKDVYGIDADFSYFAADGAPKFLDVSFKPWCAARQTMAATQALREMVAGGLIPGDIERIEAFVLPPHLKMIGHGIQPGDRASRLTSLPYQMAMAVLSPDSTLGLSLPTPDGVAGFMELISVSADKALLANYPVHWPARIVVHAKSGRQERLVNDVPGDPATPLTEAEIERKFVKLTEPVLGHEGARRLLADGLNLLSSPEALSTARQWIGKLLAGDPTSPDRG